jgi:hypothetical protein
LPIVTRQPEILITRFAVAHWASAAIGEDRHAACRLYSIDLSKTIARQKPGPLGGGQGRADRLGSERLPGIAASARV